MKIQRIRFGVRALLILTTLIAIPLALYAYNRYAAVRQIAIVKQLEAMGGRLMMYEYDVNANWEPGERTYPKWIEDFLGEMVCIR